MRRQRTTRRGSRSERTGWTMMLPPTTTERPAAPPRAVPATATRTAHVVRWTRRLLLGLLAVAIALIGAGLLFQSVAEARDRRRFPPPGRLVDVGGYRLHLQVLGAEQGAPTVLLDSAWASAAPQWGWLEAA